MDLTILLARLLGIFAIILAVSMLVHRKMVTGIFDEVFKNRALTYLMGIFETAAGLLLVLNHTIWTGTLETVITVFGWLLLIEGVFYLFVTRATLKRILKVIHEKRVYYVAVLLYFLLGLYFIVVGF